MPVTVNDIEIIYKAFRKSQADYNNRGFRLPKNFEDHFNNKFKEQNKKSLIKITGWFLTKWQNIEPYEYFLCGFRLYDKKFTYTKFFKEKILELYKTRDKNKKREINITKRGLVNSAKFVQKWMEQNHADIFEYMSTRDGNHKVAVDHYLKDKIDSSFFVYLIRRGMILTDNDRSLIPYIQTNFREISYNLNEIQDFLDKLGERL